MNFKIKIVLLCFFAVQLFPGFSQNIDIYSNNISGFGFDTKGGVDGKIIRVTNLNSAGEGSLAAAIQQTGARIVVFEVAGVIDLKESVLQIKKPFITIAGQTAPAPGITLIKGGLLITTNEVIVQHIRVRPGEAGHKKRAGWEMDGITTSKGAYNVIIDHCSVSWGTDEGISASGPRFDGKNVDEWRKNTSHKIVISNCIIAEGLNHSTHSEGKHSKGTLVHDNTTEIAIVGNLYVNNERRNPFFKGGAQGIVVNNYIYNPGGGVIHYRLAKHEWRGHKPVTGKMSVEGNLIEFGKDTPKNAAAGNFSGPVELFWKDNRVVSKVKKELRGSYTLVEKYPVWPEGFSACSSAKVKERVLSSAGACPWARDETDKRIIEMVKNKTGRIIDSESQVGGYPKILPVFQKFSIDEWDFTRFVKKRK